MTNIFVLPTTLPREKILRQAVLNAELEHFPNPAYPEKHHFLQSVISGAPRYPVSEYFCRTVRRHFRALVQL